MPNGALNSIDGKDLTFVPEENYALYQGRQIPLQETPFKVLQFIHAGHPYFVSNEKLRIGVWRTKERDPNLVQQHVSKLNKKLPSFGFWVEGKPNHGYRLVQIGTDVADHIQRRASHVSHRSNTSIEVLNDWRDANWIISKATKSLVIIDSYFGHSGEIEPLVIEALNVKTTRLKISIYLANPRKNFGAQRFKEKEKPKDRKLTFRQVLDGTDRKLQNYYRRKYQQAYDSSVGEIIGHFTKPRIRLRVYTYPIMPTTRVYIVDDMHYIFGCFPLLAHNPAYPCFWAKRDGNLSAAETVAVDRLAQQVKIIRSISKQVWPLSSRKRAIPKR